MSTQYTVTLHKHGTKAQTLVVRSLEEASAEFCRWRDENQIGSSTLGKYAGQVIKDGQRIARISYNGRAWAPDGKEIPLANVDEKLKGALAIPQSANFERLKLYPLSKIPDEEGLKITLFRHGSEAVHAVVVKEHAMFTCNEVDGSKLDMSYFTSWTPTHLEGHESLSGSAWLVEFGEQFQPPLELRALIAGGVLHDISWHNDVAPRFRLGTTHIVWCDAEDVSLRELTEGTRFWISEEDTEGAHVATILESNDIKEVLAEIIRILAKDLD